MLRFLTAGESHGPAEVVILEGIPAGLSLSVSDIQIELDKRRSGAGRGGRGIIEKDQVEILSGIRNGITIGSPITLLVQNLDYKNWGNKNIAKATNPRPGHADLAGYLKYGFDDIRNVLERASARETVTRVATGAVFKKLLKEFNIEIASHTIQIGQIKLSNNNVQFIDIKNVFIKDPEIRCINKNTSELMKKEILTATRIKNTLGGVVEIVAANVPAGLGSYVHFDRKLDGLIAQSLMSIPSVKAVEIGDGFINATKVGSDAQDEIYWENDFYKRKTNRAGGIEGGVTNGENIKARIYLKPISTIGNPLNTVDLNTHKKSKALAERSDICVVPRAGVIAESMMAYTLSRVFLEKFGNDNLHDIKYNFNGYISSRRLQK